MDPVPLDISRGEGKEILEIFEKQIKIGIKSRRIESGNDYVTSLFRSMQ